MGREQCLRPFNEFVEKVLHNDVDSPEKVFGDGRGFWNYYLPSDVSSSLSDCGGDLVVVREFVKGVITWCTHLRTRFAFAKPPGSTLCVFAILTLPVPDANQA